MNGRILPWRRTWWKLGWAAYLVALGLYGIFDAMQARRDWAADGARATGLFTDLAQAFVGHFAAIVLEMLAGLSFIAVGVREAGKARTARSVAR